MPVDTSVDSQGAPPCSASSTTLERAVGNCHLLSLRREDRSTANVSIADKTSDKTRCRAAVGLVGNKLRKMNLEQF